jgi:hypothetical protein
MKTPKNREEALEVINKLAKKFNFTYIIIDETVFKDEYFEENTGHWTKEDFRKAVASLDKELCNTSFYAVSDIIQSINSIKK